jgi:hypothetical protein
MKPGILPLMLLICCFCAYGQTVTDIEKTYGQRQQIYSVSQHIWMTPEFALDGQVCRMRLFPKRVDARSNYVGAGLQYDELRELLNSLVPLDKRGMKSKINFGSTATGGPAAWTTYPYERVTFTFTPSFQPPEPDASPRLTKGEYTFTQPQTNPRTDPESEQPSADDFLPSQSSTTEIVTIRWHDRKCQN